MKPQKLGKESSFPVTCSLLAVTEQSFGSCILPLSQLCLAITIKACLHSSSSEAAHTLAMRANSHFLCSFP